MFVENSSQLPSPTMWVVIVIAFIAAVIYGEQLIQIVSRLVFAAIKIGMLLAIVVVVYSLLSRANQAPIPASAPAEQASTVQVPFQ